MCVNKFYVFIDFFITHLLEKNRTTGSVLYIMVPKAGLEPARGLILAGF